MRIETHHLSLTSLPQEGLIHLQSRKFPNADFLARINTTCSRSSSSVKLLKTSWQIRHDAEPEIVEMSCGPVRMAQYHLDTNLENVSLAVRIGLSLSEPLALIRLDLVNQSRDSLTLGRFTLLDIESGALKLGGPAVRDPFFYSNGWQSWSATGTYRQGDKQHTSILGKFQNPMVVNPGTPKPAARNRFSGDMFGVIGDLGSRVGLVAGFLSQRHQFGSLETCFTPSPSLEVWANGDTTEIPAGKTVTTDWLALSFIDLDAPEPLTTYFQAVALEHGIDSHKPVPVGWCSWYHFYEDITQENIESNLDAVVSLSPKLPLPLFQVDDGYETHPGDWYDFDPAFPNGLKPIVEKTRTAGLTPGVWLAPYILHPKSDLVKQHPEWLLRDRNGTPVTAGFVWNSFTLALDLTNPDALAYTCDVIRTAVEDWGFKYLKLDFLYAAALEGVYQDPTLTRAQVLRMGLEALREAAGPDVTLLACGCPLGSALGLFDAMRISADVSGHWKPHFPPVSVFLQKEPHMPSARNAIRNILTRAPLHRHWWVNDPDCLLVRPDTQLTLAEVQTLTSVIGLTGGSMLLSDDLPALPEDRINLAQILLPVIDCRAQVMDLFETNPPTCLKVDLDGPVGAWHLLAKFNWEDKPASLTFSAEEFNLPKDQAWWLREFWTGLIGQMGPEPITFDNVPPHGVRVLAVRSGDRSRPVYLGSDLHLSQGMEICQWKADEEELTLEFSLGRIASGQVYLYLPWQPASVWFKGRPHEASELGEGIYSVVLDNLEGEQLTFRR